MADKINHLSEKESAWIMHLLCLAIGMQNYLEGCFLWKNENIISKCHILFAELTNCSGYLCLHSCVAPWHAADSVDIIVIC